MGVKIEAVYQLEAEKDGVFDWQCTGDDPHFYVSSTFPTGWCEIVVVMKSTVIGRPCLYLGQPCDFSEHAVIPLGMSRSGETIIRKFIYIPHGCKRLRFDPVEAAGKLSIGCFTIRPIYHPFVFYRAVRRFFALLGAVGYQQSTLQLIDFFSILWGKPRKSALLEDASLIRGELSLAENNRRYHAYILRTSLDQAQVALLKSEMDLFAYRPLFSLVVPVYNVQEKWLVEMIESVRSQIYPCWELCFADDASTQPHVRKVLEKYQQLDSRIHVVFRHENGHIAKATNSAMQIASGEFYCLMDNDDVIAPESLFEFAKLLNKDASIDMIYSDEDKITVDGKRYEPFFKPAWSPEYLESCMYTAHFACYRKSIADKTGWFRAECNGAQDYDFVLRFVEQAKNIQHIAKILYHWRAIPGSTATSMDSKDYVLGSAVKALTDMTKRCHRAAAVEVSQYPGCFHVRYALTVSPLVSIVIPTAGKRMQIRGEDVFLLEHCITSILNTSSYKNIEFIIIDNGDLDPLLIEFIQTLNSTRITYSGEINIAKKINMGAKRASGEYLLILNDDIEVISEDWLEALLEQGQKEGVGVVGAKLLFEHGGLQHVGVTFCEGLPDHVRKNFPRHDPGYLFSTVSVRNWMAVTGACMLTPRKLFLELGGYGEEFCMNYNDIDYCLKAYTSGYRVVYTPHAELFHFESVSREAFVPYKEIDLFSKKWGAITSHDPYYNESALESRPPDFFLSAASS